MMAKNIPKMPLPKLDDLFTTEEERTNDKLEKVIDIKLSDIDDFPDHPFKVIENEDMYNMRDSIKENGVLVPALVRKKPDGRYEMVSGHRRKYASQLANNETLPCIVRDLTDDEATILMVDSNIQREEILPSEKAFAYKMKLDAMKRQGKRTDLTCVQNAHRLKSRQILAEQEGKSEYQIRRYIRLTYLIPELLEYVDAEKIKLLPATEISYLGEEAQRDLCDVIETCVAFPSHGQARRLRRQYESGELTYKKTLQILEEEKGNQKPKYRLSCDKLSKYIPQGTPDAKAEEYIITALDYYSRYLRKKIAKQKI